MNHYIIDKIENLNSLNKCFTVEPIQKDNSKEEKTSTVKVRKDDISLNYIDILLNIDVQNFYSLFSFYDVLTSEN